MYYLNDGFYSAFRWISSYEVTPTPIVITVGKITMWEDIDVLVCKILRD